MAETRRLTEVSSRLAGLLDLPSGDLVIALSGGADSAAMAYLVARSGAKVRGIHVDHGLPGSETLADAARDVAGRLGLDLEVATIEVEGGPSPEGQARKARYQELLGRLRPGEWVLTAHTLEDQAETVLLNLIRGSGPRGLAGIPPRRPPVARPMLRVSRSETRELALLTGLPFADDPLNLDPTLRRNVLRLEVIPALSARFNPRLVESLARSADLLRQDDELVQLEADGVPLVFGEGSVAVALGVLRAVPGPIADRVMRRCLALVRPPYPGTTSEVAAVRAVADRERAGAVLADGVRVTVEGPLLVLRESGDRGSRSDRVDLEVGMQRVDGFEVGVERVDRICRVLPIGSWSAVFDPGAQLTATVDEKGRLSVEADGRLAWVPGEGRLGVAWYQPGTSGYLFVVAREESEWTSSL
jgi:tRNA(Ile)-lysidine synthase